MPVSPVYRPDPAFAALGPDFADPVEPAAFPNARLRWRDDRAAARVGLDTLTPDEWERHLRDFAPLPGNQPRPLAMRYHGHQFRVYNPDIGDGRGFLFAQLRDDRGRLLDLGTKGSGRTPYSRSGDGRMTLQGGVREALISAALAAAGVPGCAILSLYETGETLARNDEPSPARGAVMVRLQHSHVRIGTLQRHAAHARPDLIARLLDHCIDVYAPDLAGEGTAGRATAFLGRVVEATARLVAAWTAAGFVHGVMNSDNMTVTGESFDYGPSRFAPVFEPSFTSAYFDQGGIYALGRQAEAAVWNLRRLAECLVSLAPPADLAGEVARFAEVYPPALATAVLGRLRLAPITPEADLDFARAFFIAAEASRAPYAQLVHDAAGGAISPLARGEGRARYLAGRPDALDTLAHALADRSPVAGFDRSEGARAGESPFAPTLDRLRAIWRAIDEDDDWSGFNAAMRGGIGAAPP